MLKYNQSQSYETLRASAWFIYKEKDMFDTRFGHCKNYLILIAKNDKQHFHWRSKYSLSQQNTLKTLNFRDGYYSNYKHSFWKRSIFLKSPWIQILNETKTIRSHGRCWDWTRGSKLVFKVKIYAKIQPNSRL